MVVFALLSRGIFFSVISHRSTSSDLQFMEQNEGLKILFIINPASGTNSTDWRSAISNFFAASDHHIELFDLPKNCTTNLVREKIQAVSPNQVVAVGGDGTVKLVAECLLHTDMQLGILPAGSANGLAKELGISEEPEEALPVIANGYSKKIHVTKVNNEICIHLSDIGFNAFLIKTFDAQGGRGMLGYVWAAVKTLFKNQVMSVKMVINEKPVNIKAAMIVIANATKYGAGVLINPLGKLDDDMFEVIAVKKVSFREIFKMAITHAPYDLAKTEIFQTRTLSLHTTKRAHFQVDGEYLGKVTDVNASLLQNALEIIVPAVPQ